MSLANRLYAEVECPRCRRVGETEIEVVLDGHGAANDYRVGDTVDWNPCYGRSYSGRPPLGDLAGDGYAVCSECDKDYFVTVIIERDVIERIEVVYDRSGYIRD